MTNSQSELFPGDGVDEYSCEWLLHIDNVVGCRASCTILDKQNRRVHVWRLKHREALFCEMEWAEITSVCNNTVA